MADNPIALGTVLADKYRLDSVLGEGGMGTVYKAEHLVLKAPVAVKVIDREVAEGDVALARFMREAQSAASLRSPHVVQILDYGSDEGRPFMVMEVLEGEPLAHRIKRMGNLTPGETYRVISHVARAVAKAHEAGIIHRDLKPDNVFLVHNEGDEIAKVLDFGVAKVETTALGGDSHTRTGSLLGTPYYMSPEQAQGNKEIDHRSDLWALGVIAFECMTGKRPFVSDGLGDLVLQICIRDIPVPSAYTTVPQGFDAWFEKATQRNPDERFQSARELSEALRDALGLVRDPAGSIPESAWSTAQPNLTAGDQGLQQPAAPHATTEKDPVRVSAAGMPPGASPSQRPTNVDPGAQAGLESPVDPKAQTNHDESRAPLTSKTLLESGADQNATSSANQEESADSSRSPRGSRWEVVPPGAEDPTHESPDVALAETATEPPPPSAGRSILFVALLAMLLGAAAVYGAKRAGIDLLQLDGSSTDDGPSQSSGSKPKPATPGKAAESKPSETKWTKTPQPRKASLGDDENAGGEDAPTDGEDELTEGEEGEGVDGADADGEETDATGEGDEGSGTSTDEALDAIEAAAAEKTGGDGAQPAGETAPKKKTDGPQPVLPDGLDTPPPPPPPSQ